MLFNWDAEAHAVWNHSHAQRREINLKHALIRELVIVKAGLVLLEPDRFPSHFQQAGSIGGGQLCWSSGWSLRSGGEPLF